MNNGDFADWIGRSETLNDTITLAQATALAATLDRAEAPALGDPLPALWHWTFFTPRAPQSELGQDGHPRLGGFLPPIPLPRRMWAGGRLAFHDALRIGDSVARTTEITNIASKAGRQGPLIFVTLMHRLVTERGLAIEEEQDLVYREASKPDGTGTGTTAAVVAEPSDEPAPAAWREAIVPDTRLLFRYSALTFNAHRIHYDLPYATGEEGYPGLVVHGPLTATLLADRLMAHRRGRLTHFAFRGGSPLFAGNAANLCGEEGDEPGTYRLWAEGPGGATAMSASATIGAADAD